MKPLAKMNSEARIDFERRRLRLEMRGHVQGVGFRPHVCRLASDLRLVGWVVNDANGIAIEIEGPLHAVQSFGPQLARRLPPLARIHASETREVPLRGETSFSIRASDSKGLHHALALPDIAACSACRSEILDPQDRRYRYPFTNCTDCGPRFSIIEALPYDRGHTTMRAFTMCAVCRAEYADPRNRRFHAQPNGCPACGPRVELTTPSGRPLAAADDALLQACALIRQGRIVALKGLGGYQLLADASNDTAVQELRRRKHRPAKPLALMCPSLSSARFLCEVGRLEAGLLQSPQSPIVLMRRRGANRTVAPSVAPRSPDLGLMLPYTPLHHLLMLELDFPIVATSGNRSDEPICIDDDEALCRLREIADFFLRHDRPIARALDDSVAQVVAGRTMLLRAARGYAPSAISLAEETEPLLALGGHQKNSVAVSVGGVAVMGQHLGDLDTLPATRSFVREVESLQRLHTVAPERMIADLHPDYFTSLYAESQSKPPQKVQHHLAHLLACMTENRLQPPLLGVVWDGAGLGSDGTVWGGEFIEVRDRCWTRVAHLRPFRLPGGDAAARDPRRSALGVLHELHGDSLRDQATLFDRFSWTDADLENLVLMLREELNCPVTTSAGRLFDAAAALLGFHDASSFEGEAAMRVQFLAERGDTQESYACETREAGNRLVVDWAPVIEGILRDRADGLSIETIARKFHRALARQIAGIVGRLGAERVALSGGCFQNRLLLELTADALRRLGVAVYSHHLVPPNDGGLALGQLAAALLDLQEET
jgi:hydrogenase maturation protein HypF